MAEYFFVVVIYNLFVSNQEYIFVSSKRTVFCCLLGAYSWRSRIHAKSLGKKEITVQRENMFLSLKDNEKIESRSLLFRLVYRD